MTAYISAIFEKTHLVTASKVRVIVRNRDDGTVPPLPGPTHYPTHPDDLQSFIVGQYVSDATGDVYARIATTADITNIAERELDTFYDSSVNFITAGVLAGDVVQISIPDPQYWTSTEYTGTNPFLFQVQQVVNSTTLRMYRPFPAWANNLTWTITRLGLTGYTGITRRNGSPANGTYFRDSRFNRVFSNALDAENAVTAMKADILSLTNATVGASLVTETVTIGSSI